MKRITTPGSRAARAATARSLVLALAVVPAFALTSGPARASSMQGAATSAGAVAVAIAVRRLTRARAGDAVLAGVCGLLAILLYPWVSDLAGAAGTSLLFGVAVGLLLPPERLARSLGGSLLAAIGLLGLRAWLGEGALELASGTLVLVAAGELGTGEATGERAARVGLAVLLLPLMLLSFGWVGANSAQASWFGALVSDGPRDQPYVALTFDDGPNGDDTLRLAAILAAHDARGTFFVVGRTVEEQPEVVRTLIEDGDLVGNHSYEHTRWGYLDPRYPELDRTEAAIERVTGRCPTYYRPPHGAHTPFISRLLRDRGMHMVTWEVQANDWKETDAARLARSILDQVHPGAIVLLHDGIDGLPGADRSVLIDALPLILDGLRERGLQPVTLDRLLGGPGYLDHC